MNPKKLLSLILLVFLTMRGFSQGTLCSSATPFCTAVGTPFTYQNVTGTAVGQAGPDYGCLGSQPRPSWFYIKSSAAGAMTFSLTQSTSPGGAPNIDVDFIAYGPFSTAGFATACSNLTGGCIDGPDPGTLGDDHNCVGNTEDCSYSPAATETMTLNPTAAGQYFIIMITNFTGTAGFITFSQTGGPGSDCSIVCPNVTSGDGFTLPSGQPLPSILSCDAPAITIYASDNAPFGSPIVPGVMFNLTTTTNSTYSVNVYSASNGLVAILGPLTPTTNIDYQLYFMNPAETYSFDFCESNSAAANVPYSIMDLASGTTFTFGTWVDDGLCQTIVVPAGAITGVATFTASCGTCVTSVPSGAGSFNPSIAGVGTHTITYTFAPGAPCAPYVFSKVITVVSSTVNSAMTSTTICEGASATLTLTGGPTQTFTNTTDFTIPDGNATGISSPITVSGIPGNAGSSLTSINVNITHAWDSDLDLYLVCPSGYTIALSRANGGNGDNYTNTTFSTSGTYIYAVAAVPPFTGTFRPEDPLFALSGCASNGIWSLFVRDNATPDQGIIRDWSISFTDKNTYSWTPGANLSTTTGTNVVASPTTTTVYSVTASTNSGCLSAVKTITVTVNPKPTPSITSSNTLCIGSALTFTAGTASTFTWSTGGTGGLSGTNGTTVSATPTATGNITYTVNMTDASGCTNTTSKTITVSPLPIANAGSTNTLTCSNATISLSGSGGGTYAWTGPGITSGSATATPTINAVGTYSLVVTSAGGCISSMATVAISQNTTVPVVASATTGTLNCTALTVNASATTSTTPVSYNWAGTGITAGAGTGTITVNQPGTFNYTVTNTSNGCSTTGSQAVAQNIVVPTLTVSGTQTITCAVPTITLTGSATPSTCTPVWTGGVSSGSNSYTATASSGNIYTLTVTNPANGCVNSATTQVVASSGIPSVTTSVTNSLSCTSLTAQVVATTTASPVTYNWTGPGITSGASTATANVNAGGQYTVVVTNTVSACSSTLTISVVQNTTTPIVASANTGSLNCTVLSVNASATTSTTPVSYNWSGTGITAGASTGTISVNQGGTFNYTVTNTSNGCSTTGSQAVTQNTVAPSVASANTGSLNCTVLSVNASATTSTTPVSYNWSGSGITAGAGTGTITVNQPGTFNYTVTNTSNNCLTSGSQVITQNITGPSVVSANTGSLNCSVLSVNASATTSTTPVSYNWSGTGITAGAGTGTISVNQGGTFNYTVTNTSNNCTTTGSQAVTQNTTGPVVVSANTGSLNCTVLSVNASATTSTSPVSYNWSGTGITAGAGTGTISVNQGGTFNYTVTNTSNNCITTGSQVITQNIVAPSVASANTGSLNCTVLSVNASATTSTTPVSYNWSGTGITAGAGTGTISVNQGGTFNYTVTNTSNNCSTTGSQAVTQNTTGPVVASANTGSLNCTVLSVNASATTSTTPVSYNWSGAGITAGSGTGTITVNQPGTFNYTVTNTSNGCKATGSQIITQNIVAPAVASANTGSLNCTVLSVNASATTSTTPVSYNWSGAGITAGAGTGTISVNQGGTFNYTVTNTSNGCVTTGSQAVTQNTTAPVTIASTTGSVTCVTNTLNLNSTLAGMNYTWTAPGGSSLVSGSTLQNAVGQGLGTYTINVLNPVNNCTYTTTIAAIQNTTTPTSVDAGPNKTLVCVTPTLSLQGSATPTTAIANWLGGVSSPTTFTTSTGAAGVYTLQAIEPTTGCFIFDTVRVFQSVISPTVTSNAVTNSITCVNSVVPIGISVMCPDPFTVAWPIGTGISGPTNTLTTTATLTGVYQVTVTNTFNSCVSINSINVPINQTPVTASISPASTITCNTPSLTLSAFPVGAYTYTWSGSSAIISGGSTQNPVVNNGGTYSVAITNTVNGCIGNANITVASNTVLPVVNIASPSVTTTCGNPTVTIVATSTPSTGVTYSWTAPGSGSLNTYTVSNPIASGSGIFTVVVTNTISGCSSSLTQNTVNVTPDLAIPATTLSTNALLITCTNPTVTATISTTSSPVSYSWSPTTGIVSGTETTGTPSFTAPGSYSVVVTNTTSGCATSIGANVVTVSLDNTIPAISLTSGVNNGTITCTNTFVTISPTVTPGSNVTYTWSPSTVTSSTLTNATFTAAGVYTLSVTNTVTGCVSSATNTSNTFTVIADNAAPAFTLGTAPTVSATCAVPSVTLSGTSSADPNSVYTWTTPSSSNLTGNPIIVSAPGTYTVAVTNTVNGCSSSSISQSTVEVVADAGIPSVTLSANSLSITCTSQTVTASISTTATPVTYSWSPTAGIVAGTETTANPIFNAAGSYSSVVTNTVSGCATSITGNVVTISMDNTIPSTTLTTSAVNDGTLTCLTTSIVVTPTVSPVSSNLTYAWTPTLGIVGSTNQANVTFTATGIYTLAITNTLTGCVSVLTNSANIFTVYQNTTTPTVTLTTAAANDGTLTCLTTSIVVTPTVMPANATFTWTSSTGTFTNTSNATFTAPDVYTLTVMDAATGCMTSTTNPANIFTVYQNTTTPTMTLTTAAGNNGTLTCLTTSIVVTPTVIPSSATFTWTSSTGTFTNSLSATFTAPDVYTLTVMDAVSGCTTSTTNPANIFTVYQNTATPTMTLTTATANDGTLTCLTTSIVVTPTVLPSSATFTWTSSTGTFTNTSNATFNTPDVYTLTVVDAASGCTTSSTNPANVFTVYQNTVVPTATITAISTNSTIGCGGSSSTVTLGSTITSSNTPVISWLPVGVPTPTLDVTSAGIYTLVVVDAINSCSATAAYTVTGNSTPPAGVGAGTSANIACGSLTVALTGTTTSSNINYSWTGPSATSITFGGATANPVVNEMGTYTLTVTDNATGCQSTDVVTVTQAIATASLTANPTTGISPLTAAFTGAGAGTPSYSWNFGDTNTSPLQNPSNTFTTGTYTVTLTTTSGSCTATATVEIIVEDGFSLEIPNVFTPNDDGANDLFTIKSTGIKDISLQIFNRWGEKLYEFSGDKASWDGLAPNGAKVPEGTYFYFVNATGFDGTEIEKNGSVNLFR